MRARLPACQLTPKPFERSMQRHLDRVRPCAQQLRDLSRGEVGAVAERHELSILGTERPEGLRQLEPVDRLLLDVNRCFDVRWLRNGHPVGKDLINAPARDPDEPRDGLSFVAVVAIAVTERALESVVGSVLGVGTIAQAVGGVRINTANQRFRI